MRARRVRGWRDFRTAAFMAAHRSNPVALRAEARLLTVAGVVLLGVGFPVTLVMVAIALGSGADDHAGLSCLPLCLAAYGEGEGNREQSALSSAAPAVLTVVPR